MNPTMGQLESVKTYNALIDEGLRKRFLKKDSYGNYYLSTLWKWSKPSITTYSHFIFQLSKATVFVEVETELKVHVHAHLDGAPSWRTVDEDIPAPEADDAWYHILHQTRQGDVLIGLPTFYVGPYWTLDMPQAKRFQGRKAANEMREKVLATTSELVHASVTVEPVA